MGITFQLNDGLVQEVDQIAKDCGTTSRVEVVNAALELFQWAVREVKRGRKIASVDEKERHLEIVNMAIFMQARGNAPSGTRRQ